MFSVQLMPQPLRFYLDADSPLSRKLARCFEQLEANPRAHPNMIPLRGPLAGFYRYRVGDHRVIYRIDFNQKIVVVARIAHRREAYGW